MKNVIAVGLVIALVADIALFAGIGFGTGGLNTGASVQSGYVANWVNAGSSPGDGMSWRVSMSPTSVPMTTAALPGFQSTSVSFGLNVYSTGDCGNTLHPVWEPGSGSNYGYYVIQYLVGGNPIPWSGMVDGVSSTSTAAGFPVTANGSVTVKYCVISNQGNDVVTAGLSSSSTIYAVQSGGSPHSVSVSGLVPSGILRISFYLFYTKCYGNVAAFGVCGDALAATNGIATTQQSPNGGSAISTSSSINAYSAGASVSPTRGGVFYNGQTLSVTVSTGYDGPNGYQLYVQCPSARSCSGAPDPGFAQYTVANSVNGAVFSWAIPIGYAVNNSAPGWNIVSVTLVANYGVAAQTIGVQINIAPLFDPKAPVVTWTDSNGTRYPSIGDSVTVTVFANASARSAPVSAVLLSLYYLQPGQTSASAPSCGAAWITSGCPSGQSLTLIAGNRTVSTFTFMVNPPLNFVAIGGKAVSQTSTAQGNTTPFLFINIKPVNCVVGTPCDPTNAQASLWSVVGPILFAAAIVIAGALVAFAFPLPAFGRVLAIVVAGGAVIVLYVIGFAQWFLPGGVL